MLKRLAILAIGGTFLFGWPSVAENHESKAHTEHAEGAQPQQPVPPTHVVIDPSSATVHVETKPANDKQASEEKPLPMFLRPEWVIVYITAVYVFITGWMLLAIKRQASQMEGQTNILRDSVAAAKQAADAADKSATAAMGIAIPTLVLVHFDFAEKDTPSLEAKLQSPEMRVVGKNHGQTPAILKSYGLKYSCEVIPLNAHIPVAWAFEDGEVIEAGREHIFKDLAYTPWEPFSTEDVAAIIANTKTLKIAGCLRYGDIFGSPVRSFRFSKEMFLRSDGISVFWMDSDLTEKYVSHATEAQQS